MIVTVIFNDLEWICDVPNPNPSNYSFRNIKNKCLSARHSKSQFVHVRLDVTLKNRPIDDSPCEITL